ncbi:hypothetical protein QBC42DRAFT_291429 [Cladorrhinum samala]|uniref:Uncharacterized protein n=1 Tax=Cladorrhinum samala TaxID=585594 RepID=A0AAV9HDP5_9PEZI|nr:hypothetical protein QBC42DRAFT_291429 [Cladorrhinum samala]
MVNFVSILAVALLAVSQGVEAKNCKARLHYCGRGLLNKGNYYDQIIEALTGAGQPTDTDHVNSSLFYCKTDGNIIFQSYCGSGGCVNGGAGNSDYC